MAQLTRRPALLILAVTAALYGATAHADDDRIFDNGIGAGGSIANVAPAEAPEALIKIETNFCKSLTDTLCLVIARGTATGTISSTGGVGKLNIDYDMLGGEFDVNHDQSVVVGASLFNVVIERNVAIDEQHFIRLSFAGFRAHGHINATKDLELFARAAVDILGLAYAQTVTQGREITGISQSGSLEVGALLFKRIRVSLSERFGLVTGSENVVVPGTVKTCTPQVDPTTGTVAQVCTTANQTVPRDQIWSSVTELSVKINIVKHLLMFAEGSYSYFHVSDQLGGAPDPASDGTPVAVGAPLNQGLGVFMGQIGLELVF